MRQRKCKPIVQLTFEQAFILRANQLIYFHGLLDLHK